MPRILVALLCVCVFGDLAAAQYYTLRFVTSSGRPRDAWALAFSPDSTTLCISIARDKVYAIDVAAGESMLEYDVTPFELEYAADGNTLLSVGEDGFFLLNPSTGEKVRASFNIPAGKLGLGLERKSGKLLVASVGDDGPAQRSGLINPGDELLAVVRGGTRTRVVGRSVRSALKAIAGPVGTPLALEILPRGKRDATLVPLRLTRVESVGDQERFVYDSRAIAGRRVGIFASQGLIVLMDAANARVNSLIAPRQIKLIGQNAVSEDGRLFGQVGVCLDKDDGKLAIELFDIASQERLGFHPVDDASYLQTRFSHDGRYYYVGGEERLHIFSVEQKKFLDPFFIGWRPPTAEQLAEEDNKKAAPDTAGAAIAAWDRMGISSSKMRSPNKLLYSFDVSDHGVLAVGGHRGEVTLWSLETGEKLADVEEVTRGAGRTHLTEFSPDGKWLAYYIDGVLTLQSVTDVLSAASE